MAVLGRRARRRRGCPPAPRAAPPPRGRERPQPLLPVPPSRARRRPRLHGMARPGSLSLLAAAGGPGNRDRRGLRLRRDAAPRHHDGRGLLLRPGRRQRERGGGHPGGETGRDPARPGPRLLRLVRGAAGISRDGGRGDSTMPGAHGAVRGRSDGDRPAGAAQPPRRIPGDDSRRGRARGGGPGAVSHPRRGVPRRARPGGGPLRRHTRAVSRSAGGAGAAARSAFTASGSTAAKSSSWPSGARVWPTARPRT